MGSLLDTALRLHAAGIAPLPTRVDGTKAPAVAWKPYTDTPPTSDQVHAWFTGLDTDGLGAITGAASGGLELFELEARAVAEGLLPQLAQAMTDHGQGDLWQRVSTGWVEATPTGGIHWHYRVTGTAPRRNTKLARRPATPAELAANPADRIKVLIETRGQGGFVVLAPSAGRTHPTGRAWTTITGGPHTTPTITGDERDALHAIAGTLDQLPPPDLATGAQGRTRGAGDPLRPGDDYNARATWDDILTPRGWVKARHFGGTTYGWRRPGKTDPGISATTGRNDGDNLYVFTTSTEFEPETPYTKFGALALLDHGGDYHAAAKALAGRGYGEPITPREPLDLHQLVNGAMPQPDAPADRPTLYAVDGSTARVVETLTPAKVARHYGHTQDGTARALADLHHTRLRYCPQRSMWLAWTGSRWAWDYDETHREHIRELARDLPDDSPTWQRHKHASLTSNGVTGIARLARTDPRLVVHIDALDAHPYELNTPAGVLDLRTATLRPADPASLHTRTTTVAPDFTRASDLFTRFLATTFDHDPDLIGYVQRLAGLSAIGTVLEQILPFGLGPGANGKTTLTEALQYTLGNGENGYSMSAPSEMLMARKYSEHPAELAQLAGSRLVICSELDDGQRFAEARVKMLTGRDSINARFMRQDPFTFRPSHTIWLLGNHRPDATAGGPAFWRRVQLLPFRHVVPDHQRDPQLSQKLQQEAPAVLAWLAQGAASYLAGGLDTPTAVKDATHAYAVDQDTVGRFVDEACHLATAAPGVVQTKVGAVRAAYERWCAEAGEEPVPAKRLTQELRDRWGVEAVKGTHGVRLYAGLALLSSSGEDEQGGLGGSW